MIFQVGERVSCGGHHGTIREAIRQRNTGDAFRIDFDGEPHTDELYKDIELTSLSQDDAPVRWAA